MTQISKLNYCNYCEHTWIDGFEDMVRECPTCSATVCEKCENEGKHQGCTDELWESSYDNTD
jgi:hypothetical protein